MPSTVRKWIEQNLQDEDFAQMYVQEKAKIELANAIIDARKRKNLRQVDLTQMTGIKQSEISKIENAQVYPNLLTIIKIFDALDLKIQVLSK
jgi:ribosome-binding protein aMBF1 (putative translation factor)